MVGVPVHDAGVTITAEYVLPSTSVEEALQKVSIVLVVEFMNEPVVQPVGQKPDALSSHGSTAAKT
jgi:hypothetical protein